MYKERGYHGVDLFGGLRGVGEGANTCSRVGPEVSRQRLVEEERDLRLYRLMRERGGAQRETSPMPRFPPGLVIPIPG